MRRRLPERIEATGLVGNIMRKEWGIESSIRSPQTPPCPDFDTLHSRLLVLTPTRDLSGSGAPLISAMNVLGAEFMTHGPVRARARLVDGEGNSFSVECGDAPFWLSPGAARVRRPQTHALTSKFFAGFGGFVVRGERVADHGPCPPGFYRYQGPMRNRTTYRAQGARHITVSLGHVRKCGREHAGFTRVGVCRLCSYRADLRPARMPYRSSHSARRRVSESKEAPMRWT